MASRRNHLLKNPRVKRMLLMINDTENHVATSSGLTLNRKCANIVQDSEPEESLSIKSITDNNLRGSVLTLNRNYGNIVQDSNPEESMFIKAITDYNLRGSGLSLNRNDSNIVQESKPAESMSIKAIIDYDLRGLPRKKYGDCATEVSAADLSSCCSEYILDIKKLVNPINWRRDKDGNTIRCWSDVMEIYVSSSEQDKVFFKYDYDEAYSELNILNAFQMKRRGRKPKIDPLIEEIVLERAYHRPLPISKALHTDLLSLCNSKAIPRYYHSFYESLISEENSDDCNIEQEDDDANDNTD